MRESEIGAQKGSKTRVRVKGKSWGSTGGTGRIVTIASELNLSRIICLSVTSWFDILRQVVHMIPRSLITYDEPFQITRVPRKSA